MALIWSAHGAILRGYAERHPERKVPPRGSDSPAHLCRRYSATTSTIFRWRFLGCRGCGWRRCCRRYEPAPPAQTAAGRSIGPSRGRQQSGLLIGRVWGITSGYQKSASISACALDLLSSISEYFKICFVRKHTISCCICRFTQDTQLHKRLYRGRSRVIADFKSL